MRTTKKTTKQTKPQTRDYISSRCSHALKGDTGVGEGSRFWSQVPNEDTWVPCARSALRQQLTGFGASLDGFLLHSRRRISGCFFYEICRANLKIRTPDYTSHSTNTELGTVPVLNGLQSKNSLNKDYCILLTYEVEELSSHGEFFQSHKRGIVEHGFNPRCLAYRSHHLYCQFSSWCLWRLRSHEPSSYHSIATARDSQLNFLQKSAENHVLCVKKQPLKA